mmetsp:Transcript_29384/g.75183  ORF Transcript_29384/g.75183 Transcript_29384/m.75183 type:complete len:239 (-) Transcript_29384:146-862(-)
MSWDSPRSVLQNTFQFTTRQQYPIVAMPTSAAPWSYWLTATPRCTSSCRARGITKWTTVLEPRVPASQATPSLCRARCRRWRCMCMSSRNTSPPSSTPSASVRVNGIRSAWKPLNNRWDSSRSPCPCRCRQLLRAASTCSRCGARTRTRWPRTFTAVRMTCSCQEPVIFRSQGTMGFTRCSTINAQSSSSCWVRSVFCAAAAARSMRSMRKRSMHPRSPKSVPAWPRTNPKWLRRERM